MRDVLLQSAGALALLASAIHGYLGETAVFAKARIEPDRLRRLIHLVWHCGTVAWVGLAALLIATPTFGPGEARAWIVGVAVAVYGFAAAANALATRGRHFGWMMMIAVCGLAVGGL